MRLVYKCVFILGYVIREKYSMMILFDQGKRDYYTNRTGIDQKV